jgi:hypothetical protein
VRTVKRIEFAVDADKVFWCACERCGALGPCVTEHRYDDCAGELVSVRYGIRGCCRPGIVWQIRGADPRDWEAVV